MKTIFQTITLSVLLLFYSLAFSQGYYMEYKVSMPGKGSTTGFMKAYAQDGNNRMDINIVNPGLPTGSVNLTTLALKAEPQYAYLLNDETKTYSQISVMNSDVYRDTKPSDYEVTVVGKEKVNGYNTTRCTIKDKTTGLQQEIWTTRDIADFGSFASIKTRYTTTGLWAALDARQASGLPVRIQQKERGEILQLDLVKADKRNNPSSLFSLTGYKKGGAIPGMPADFDPSKIQDMSPAERQKMLEELMKQYGGDNK